MATLNFLSLVRSTCNSVAEEASHVFIDDVAIDSLADEIMSTSSGGDHKKGEMVDFSEVLSGVTWDASGWHYSEDAAASGPLTCQYVFVLDALNFCFWPIAGLEYDTLALSLKKALEADSTCFSAENLSKITEDTIKDWFGCELPQMSERVNRLRELGDALGRDFGGLAANLVFAADHSAVRLVELILRHLYGFRDTSVYRGRLVHFYKRAQILVGDLWAAYGRPQPGHPFYLADIDQLTMFADYRVPQLLRALNIMKYSDALSASIDGLVQIPFGSEEEVELRAATVVAVERLHAKLVARGARILVIELDWLLWQRGEQIKESIKPHHRTLTVFY